MTKQTSADAPSAGYLAASQRPLMMLAFLSPLLLFHEVGAVIFFANQGGWDVDRLRARKILGGIFEAFGATGLLLPGLALVAVLLVWHVMLRDRWRVRASTLAGMGVETLAWTVPLVLLMGFLRMVLEGRPGGEGSAAIALQDAGETLRSMPMLAALTMAVGAGIFEELLFRMMLMAAVHVVAVDAGRLPDRVGRGIALVTSVVVFALFHDPYLPGGGFDWPAIVELSAAGAWFGLLYLTRGFAIAAGTHALYDAAIAVVFRG